MSSLNTAINRNPCTLESLMPSHFSQSFIGTRYKYRLTPSKLTLTDLGPSWWFTSLHKERSGYCSKERKVISKTNSCNRFFHLVYILYQKFVEKSNIYSASLSCGINFVIGMEYALGSTISASKSISPLITSFKLIQSS